MLRSILSPKGSTHIENIYTVKIFRHFYQPPLLHIIPIEIVVGKAVQILWEKQIKQIANSNDNYSDLHDTIWPR